MSTIAKTSMLLVLWSSGVSSQPSARPSATESILSGSGVFDELRRDKSTETTGLFERAFAQAKDHPNRRRLALELVLRGVPDGKYLQYLIDRVLFVSDYDGPDPFAYDSQGGQVRGTYSPVFLDWCKGKAADPNEQFTTYVYEALQDIQALELTNLPEALQVMRLVLKRSQSQAAVLGAARAVGRARDGRDIEAIATAASRFSREIVRKSIFLTAYEFYDRPEDVKKIETVLAIHPLVLARYRLTLAERVKRGELKGSGIVHPKE